MTPYQKRIIELAGIEFEDILDEDVLLWYSDTPGTHSGGWYYLYRSDGRLKDIQKGKIVSLKERQGSRPALPVSEPKQVVVQVPRKRGRPRKHFDV